MRKILLVLALFALCRAPVQATTLWWSGNGTTVGGAGTWDTTNPRWGASTSGPFTVVWNNANTDSAILHSNIAGGSVVIGAPITMRGTFQFDQTTGAFASYTVNGSSTITFNAGSVISCANASGTGINVGNMNCPYAGTITKTGPAQLTFNNANGNVTKFIINQGTASFAAANRFGGGADIPDFLTLNGGALSVNTTVNFPLGKSITLGASGGSIVSASSTIYITIANKISGTAGGTLTLSGALRTIISNTGNNWDGGLITANPVLTGASEVIPDTAVVTLNSGGTLDTRGGFLISVSVTAGGTGYTTAPTVVFTGGGFATAATATATIASGAVTSVTITGNGIGYTTAPTVSFTGGGGSGAAATANLGPVGPFNETVKSVSGSAGTVAIGAGTLTLSNPAGETYSSVFTGTGAGKIIKNGAGTIGLSGSSTGFTGEFDLNAGTVGVGGVNCFGGTGGTGKLRINGGTIANTAATGRVMVIPLDIGGSFTYDQSLFGPTSGQISFNSGAITLKVANPTITVSPAAYILPFSAVIGDGGAGFGFTKAGPGQITLNGINTYTGATLVNAGTLACKGTIAGPVTIFPGGTLAPGGSGALGTQTINNTVQLAGVTAMELNRASSPNSDQINGMTSVTYAGTLAATNLGAALQNGDTFTLFTAGSYGGSFGNMILPALSPPTLFWVTSTLYANGQISVAAPPILLGSCPADITVPATSTAGTVVNYTTPTANAGCTPPTVSANPPSGSTFPVGTNTVTVTASDTCGQTVFCTFKVTVNPPAVAEAEYFFADRILPPTNGMYIPPPLMQVSYGTQFAIRRAKHRDFSFGQLPPLLGQNQTENFGSVVECEFSSDSGNTWTPVSATAQVSVKLTHSLDASGVSYYDTEMLQLDISGGGLPAGVMIRESPTLQSTGQTTQRALSGGGYMTSSFFDIFTELSIDGGQNWMPALNTHHMVLRKNPKRSPTVPEPTPLLPPPNDKYVSPDQWHALYAQGIVIKDVSHKLFTDSHPPPPAGVTNPHSFNSTVDMKVSVDGGLTYQFVRAAAPVSVQVAGVSTGDDAIYDTEMTGLDISLPGGSMIRESPTLPSRGGTEIALQPDGTYKINSFFDIFTELSLDGGASWSPATNGPVHMELVSQAPEIPKPTPNLPPPNGGYVSPSDWHALYANGIIITNASHDRFTQTQPPPPPNGNQTENFGSTVALQYSTDGGVTFTPATAQASVSVDVNSRSDLDGLVSNGTRYFDSEMTQLGISGGTLPAGMMIRESPTLASKGKTSVRQDSGNSFHISSFFDIFTELSLDGGQTWIPTTNAPGTMALAPSPVLAITCPSNITVIAAGQAGAVVNYTVITTGGCPPLNLVVNPPSGSTFPVGTTTVNASVTDSCSQVANCSFTVTVLAPVTEYFTPQPLLPPPNTVYISPALWHALFANGVVIRDVRHRFFTQNYPLPGLGQSQPETFNSEVDFDLSTDNGASFQPATGSAQVTVLVSHTVDVGSTMVFNTEMLQLSLTSGALMLRESPTLQSTGQTTVRPVAGGYMVSSFFDIFPEVSMDNGISWLPAQQPAHVELRNDPATVPPVSHPTQLLPPPNGAYVSPQQWHALFAQGIVIKDVSHKFFTDSQPPPASGSSSHSFGSVLDLSVSTDGGVSYQSLRVAAPVTVSVTAQGSGNSRFFDTEMTDLTITLPSGVMIRESPSLPSRGATLLAPSGLPPGDPDFDLLRISSFFDIFPEVSLDGGATWSPATNGPVRMQLTEPAPEVPKPTPNLPPLDGSYVSPAKWHALFANGIILTNASHDKFTQTQPPPPPGNSQTENFGSTVRGQISMDGGASFQPFSAPASVGVQVTSHSSLDSGNTRFFDTEMLSLSLSGGSLPGGVMIRESPSKASLGRTSVRTVPSDGTYRINSFFDIFTEVSLDGGANWSPSMTAPGTMGLHTNQPGVAVNITCPADITVTASGPAGAVVFYTVTASGGCSPPTVIANPPSGSTFPIGTTTVTATASDTCGNSATCSFTITVRSPVPDYFTPYYLLPPPGSAYISPAQWHVLYAQGIVIRDVRHRFFTQHLPPPPLGTSQVHLFGSEIDYEISFDNGNTFSPGSGTANVQVQVTHTQDDSSGQHFDTEMLQLELTGQGFMLRESPTLQSTGQTTVRPVAGGYMIGSFFDVFTELSTDGGISWTPAQAAAHVELRNDPATVNPVSHPTSLLPPPTGAYVSPQQWHALYAQGIVIKDASHKIFTQSFLPPGAGTTDTHTFGSELDLSVSLDGGASFQSVRADSTVTVSVAGEGSGSSGFFDTEMLQLDATVQVGVQLLKIRESPTLPSRGATESKVQSDGTYRIGSFFDIFPEISLDGGATWSGATNGPVRMQLSPNAPEVPKPSPNLPPLDGSYVSPAQWHALYANGIIITNASHDRFTQTQPPPLPGSSQIENFGSMVSGLVSMNGGVSFTPFSAPANVAVAVQSRADLDTGTTRFFDTEMLSLSLSGGTLPGGVMVRESPSKASLGRTSIRTAATGYQIGSFFDIFTEVSLDGGANWSPSMTKPGTMGLSTNTPGPALTITCPTNLMVTATGPAGAVVFYTVSTSGGCAPVTVVANPPIGSTFPIGTTTVTGTATDACGNTATCNFTITVVLPTPVAPEYFNPQPVLPPPGSVYISPAQWHVLFAQGIIIRDVRHRGFTQQYPLPTLGASQSESFSSELDFDLSADNGNTFQPASATANVTVQVTHTQDTGGTQFFDTEMLQLDLVGSGFMLRESPTLQSKGQTTVRPVAGGYMISSFFDIFTEVSTDNGNTWHPAQQPGHVEMHPDPSDVPPAPTPTTLLPPPNGVYVSPQLWHALFAQGIVIRDVRHKFFTGALQPPGPGLTNIHTFNSQVDMQVSTDGGNTYQYLRVAAPVQVSVASHGSSANTLYDTEMLSLDLSLPNGIMLRESPSLPSRGQTQITSQGDGTYRINSFFDIFTELSLDGGASWSPATNGPVRVELTTPAPEVPKPSSNLPPLDGSYVSPAQWHALYANGIIITNASHDRFTQTQPPPPPGGSQTENFGSRVTGQISLNGGVSFTPFSAPASVDVQVTSHSSLDTPSVRFFDTEMLSLNLSGGTLPGGVMVRESPSKASLGRTSVRSDGVGFHISSFFDIFTEVSLDGGENWSSGVTFPGTMGLNPPPTNSQTAILLNCSSNITVTATGPSGAVVFYTSSATGGCPPGPPTVICNPPSGSNFPIGTTTVTCTASDNCGTITNCSFTVTVNPPGASVPEYFSATNALPVPDSVYISPAQWHALYAQGIVIRDIRHRFFTQSFPPPPLLGATEVHTFGSEVDFEVSTDNGATFQPVTANANATVKVTHSQDSTGTSFYDTEMLALNLTSSGLMLRESPTLQSTGQTTVRPVAGGYMISSFFDIFPEVSVDGGQTWLAPQQPAHVELRKDPRAVPTVTEPGTLLPPPNDAYISPAKWHALFAQGIVIKDASHKFFNGSLTPPPPGLTNTHSFDSTLDLKLSTDGGQNYQFLRLTNVPVLVTVANSGSGNSGMYETEMTGLNLSGANGLPNGIMLRESPTIRSTGATQIDPQPDGTSRMSSFFDIFLELSLDGGQSWAPPTNGPVRVQLTALGGEVPSSTQNLPLTNAPYVSPADWHAAYANGIYISNVTHSGFTQSYPPPAPNGSQTENFNSTVDMQISMDGGHTFIPASCTMTASVQVVSKVTPGSTRYFDTEMLGLSLSGGSTLPGGIKLRESPSKASTGRTSIRQDSDGTYRINSFFDIFTELSLDGGNTWMASTNPPARMTPRLPPKKRFFPRPNLPPTNSQYISPKQWHALYANGIVISNVSHKRFLANLPPPAPRSTNTHNFGSLVTFLLKMPGGQFQPMTANADCQVSVGSSGFQGREQVYQTEMLALNLSGGSLPAGVMIRESPTRRSTGETRYSGGGGAGGFRINSFFDIFTELSMDGGQNWIPASSPGYMELHVDPGVPPTTIVQPRLINGVPTFSVATQLALNYLLQYKENLDDQTWTTISITPGTGEQLDLIDCCPPPGPSRPHRFYRVEVQEDDLY